MGQRLTLSEKFHALCANVYFQPPSGKQLKYPCILYSLVSLRADYADNKPYSLGDEYSVMYVTRNPDDPNIRKIARLEHCSAGRFYTSDNLYHYPYTIIDKE